MTFRITLAAIRTTSIMSNGYGGGFRFVGQESMAIAGTKVGILVLQENHKITITVQETRGGDCLTSGAKAECSQLPGFGQ